MHPRRLSLALSLVSLLVCGLSLASASSAHGMGRLPEPPAAERARPDRLELTYTQLLARAHGGAIASVQIDETTGVARAVLRDGREAVSVVPDDVSVLVERLAGEGVQISFVRSRLPGYGGGTSPLATFLGVAFVGLLLVGLLLLVQRRSGGGSGAPAGTSLRADAEVATVPNVRFADVAGCEEAVEELLELLHFLRHPERYAALGAHMPSAAILYGPPGTGKTLLAKALSGEAGVPFFACSGSEFVETFVGVGAKRVRELFARAKASPVGAVVFIDEIDAIGKTRGGANSHEERESTLNQLLVELDGFDSSARVVCLAATNRLDTLDPALLRPGRFGRQIAVDLPGAEGRLAILGVHARGKPLAEDVDLAAIAERSSGMSGAQLSELVNEAAIMAARAERSQITAADFNEAELRVLLGPEKRGSRLAEGELEVIAYHEAGHVLCAELCPNHEKAKRASVRPRGKAAGVALYGRSDRVLADSEYLFEQMVCALGGRAAEQLVYGKVSSGAANDLLVANRIARQAIEELGLSAEVGQIVSAPHVGRVAERTKGKIDVAIEQLVADAYRQALALLEGNRPQLDRLAQLLLRQRDVERLDIVAAATGARALPLRSSLGTESRPAAAPRSTAAPLPSRRPLRQGRLARGLRALCSLRPLRGRARMRAGVTASERSL
jgi:cell division protease FtsH